MADQSELLTLLYSLHSQFCVYQELLLLENSLPFHKLYIGAQQECALVLLPDFREPDQEDVTVSFAHIWRSTSVNSSLTTAASTTQLLPVILSTDSKQQLLIS